MSRRGVYGALAVNADDSREVEVAEAEFAPIPVDAVKEISDKEGDEPDRA